MAETIETFVAKLQQEGVEAGRKEADRIREEARKQAEDIVAEARREAEKLIADARAKADDMLARARTELALASRDAILRLREALSRGLSALLAHEVGKDLEDPQFIGKVLHEIVMLFVQSDFKKARETLKINVRPEMRDKLVSWAMSEIGKEVVEQVRPSIDLKGTLAEAGFEYTCGGSTVEVTTDSVVETLMDLVGPSLHEAIAKAAAENAGAGGKAGENERE
ncbi:MAG: hypothetical protein J7M21_04740 [Planctomycetes bacterium]|nr:hypothetical protein [Planctomycetota bacterium]